MDEYATTGKLVAKHFGKDRVVDDLRPEDFKSLRAAMARKWGPVRLGNEIQRVRMIFRHAEEQLGKTFQFGLAFKKPTAKVIRLSRAERGPRDFAPEQITAIFGKASLNMKAMILLGINGGLGNTDLGVLKTRAVDLDGGWLDFPRPMTGASQDSALA